MQVEVVTATLCRVHDGNAVYLADWSYIDCDCGFDRAAGDEPCEHIRAAQAYIAADRQRAFDERFSAMTKAEYDAFWEDRIAREFPA